MTFFWASRANAELIKVICASILAHLSTEVTVEEQPQHPEAHASLYSMYNPHSDLAVFLALVSVAFLLRVFSVFASESEKPKKKTRRRRARDESPENPEDPIPLRRSARLLAKAQAKQVYRL
jgi:hypothetical protein